LIIETAPVKILLLTPGPLTTTEMTRAALNRDWGSRDEEFIELSKRVRRRLTDIAGVADTHTTIPIQGSGTFAVEATLQTLMPHGGRLLVLINGTYGRRIAEITRRLGRSVVRWLTMRPSRMSLSFIARQPAAFSIRSRALPALWAGMAAVC
jgi:2-aminoethylphosphonate-pyruvate transaminase